MGPEDAHGPPRGTVIQQVNAPSVRPCREDARTNADRNRQKSVLFFHIRDAAYLTIALSSRLDSISQPGRCGGADAPAAATMQCPCDPSRSPERHGGHRLGHAEQAQTWRDRVL